MPMLVETPHSREPTQKMPTAVSSTGFRPKMSEIFPHMGATAASISKRRLEMTLDLAANGNDGGETEIGATHGVTA